MGFSVLTYYSSLQDLVIRNETNKLVTDLVDFDRVQSLLLMISHRRRYMRLKEQMRLQQLVQEGGSKASSFCRTELKDT